MTSKKFNEKYKDYIEKGFYGLEFDQELVTIFLDEVFQDLIKIPDFKFSQIKLKFGYARFYSSLGIVLTNLIEEKINSLSNEYKLPEHLRNE